MKKPLKQLGMCDCERDMLDAARRDRNIVLAIVAVLVAGYVALSFIGGTGL